MGTPLYFNPRKPHKLPNLPVQTDRRIKRQVSIAADNLYVEWGRRDEVTETIEDLLANPKVNPSVAAILGDKDLAFQRLEARYEEHHIGMVHLKTQPLYDNLRSDPRYEDLLRRMNFPE